MPSLYTERLSGRPGDRIAICASAKAPACRLTVSRIGQDRDIVHAIDIQVGNHPTPDDAYAAGCGWPVAHHLTIGDDWRSGYYDLELAEAGGETAHHFICVRPRADASGARALLVLATNTYHAYNYWGGRCAYSNVSALLAGASMDDAMREAAGLLSTRRPFPPMFVDPPADIPRLVNLRPRGFEEKPWASVPEWRVGRQVLPYDGAAGFMHKWEHVFVTWAEGEGIALDYAIDQDLDAPDALDGYAAALCVGHSEYWSAAQRDTIENFVDGGGNLAIFSGNTAFWKVRFENDGATFVCHKWRGFENDPVVKDDPAQATHLWSHKAIARPEAGITGLTFLLGGYHRLGMCVSRGQGGYTVYNPDHWTLAGTDLYYGDLIAPDVPLLGFETDGCRFVFGKDGVPRALPFLGVPENLEIVGIAPCAFGEAKGPYAPIIPPEHLDIIARDAFDDPEFADEPGIIRGHGVMASFKRGAGEVFNGGTTEWAHALAAGDPYVGRITRNVLGRFGCL